MDKRDHVASPKSLWCQDGGNRTDGQEKSLRSRLGKGVEGPTFERRSSAGTMPFSRCDLCTLYSNQLSIASNNLAKPLTLWVQSGLGQLLPPELPRPAPRHAASCRSPCGEALNCVSTHRHTTCAIRGCPLESSVKVRPRLGSNQRPCG